MLSALIQSEAAIVALVVTLSLVAVQLAASSYSARVIEVFRKAPDLWILMGIYGIAIFYGLGVLKLIEKANPQICDTDLICHSNLEGNIIFCYYLGVFTFMALAPYIWNTLEMLKPFTVIDLLAKEITGDIVNGSIMKYDYETVRYGLEEIGNRCNYIFRNENFKVVEQKKISGHIFTHLARIGKLSVSRGDEDSTQQVIANLCKNGITAAKNEHEEAVWVAIGNILLIGTSAAEKELEASTEKAALSLEEIGKASVEKNLKIKSKEAGWWEAIYLKKIGVKAAEYSTKNSRCYCRS